jgi:L-ascorbate metabolism protein UlaG (beta-lactamase superfamily)
MAQKNPIELTWFGHATWLIRHGDHSILVDPFLGDNPSANTDPDEVDADTILVSHGHFDHIADAAPIAKRCKAQVITNYEISEWLKNRHDVEDTVGMNIGGNYRAKFGNVRLTHAIHSSQLPDGSYGGNPGGFVITLGERNLYFACDTALFSDMRLTGDLGIDLAVLPIGDLFTMGIDDSVKATELIRPKQVAPSHYNTWPPIEQDAKRWAAQVREHTRAEPLVPETGKPFRI